MGLTVVSVRNLIQKIQRLQSVEKPDCDVELIEKLRKKFEDRNDEEPLSSQDIKLLASIYERRWESIKKTQFNYLINIGSSNEAWLSLASLLEKKRVLEKTAYHLLIPTLKNGTEVDVLGRPITDFSLADCILTDDKLLVPLVVCINYHKSNGVFGMPLSLELDGKFRGDSLNTFIRPGRISPDELKQLKFKKEFYKYYKDTVLPQERDELRISRRTHQELLKLVNDSFRQKGLLAGTSYDEDEITIAELAYHNFACYISEISEEEKIALFTQRIELPGDAKRFRDVWELVINQRYRDEGCIATNTKYYIQLLLDYWPDTQFSNEILASKTMKDLISQSISKKKVFNDYSWLEVYDINSIVERIKNSIESKAFSCFYLTGAIIKNSQGIKKKVPDSVQKISKLIEENKTNPHYAYTMIVESVVIPKLESSHYFRYDDTDEWLLSILLIPCILFKPQVLLTKIFNAKQEKDTSTTCWKVLNYTCEQVVELHLDKVDFGSENYQVGVYKALIEAYKKLKTSHDKQYFLREIFLIDALDIKKGNSEFVILLKEIIIKYCADKAAIKNCKGYLNSYKVIDSKNSERNASLLSTHTSLEKIQDIEPFIDSIEDLLFKAHPAKNNIAIKKINSSPNITAVI